MRRLLLAASVLLMLLGTVLVFAATPASPDAVATANMSVAKRVVDGIATANVATATAMGGSGQATATSVATATSGATATATSGRGAPTFSDEFNGTSVDTAKWNTKCDGATASDLSYCGGADQYFDASALSESGGALHITASPKAMNGHPYTSGIVWTDNKGFAQSFGYWEIRAKLPAGMGMWPAFWGIPNNGGPPEIDAFEMYAGTSTSILDYTVHWPGCSNDSGCQKQGQTSPTGGDLTTGFHTYAIDWRSDHIIWYVDGIEQFRLTSADAPIPQVAFVPIIELQVGSAWNDQHGAGETAVMDVDYIRLYA